MNKRAILIDVFVCECARENDSQKKNSLFMEEKKHSI